MILLAVVFLMIAISTIVIFMFKDQTDEAQDKAVQVMAGADNPARRINGKMYNIRPYEMRLQAAKPYNTSVLKGKIPELPEAWSDYLLYRKHDNVEICTIYDNDIINELTVGQHVHLIVECMDDTGYMDVIIYANGKIIGYLPVSAVRKEILRKRDIQWHEEAYIDSIDHEGRITLLIGLYKLYNLTKLETEKNRLIDLVKAS